MREIETNITEERRTLLNIQSMIMALGNDIHEDKSKYDIEVANDNILWFVNEKLGDQ